jgi:hypothetical protein
VAEQARHVSPLGGVADYVASQNAHRGRVAGGDVDIEPLSNDLGDVTRGQRFHVLTLPPGGRGRIRQARRGGPLLFVVLREGTHLGIRPSPVCSTGRATVIAAA